MLREKGFVVPAILLIILFGAVLFLSGYILGKFTGLTVKNPLTVSDQGLFRENYQEQSAAGNAIASDSGKVITHGSRDRKRIALTFDAEMTEGMKAALLRGKLKNSYDQRIIETLRSTKTKATFFLTGMWIELYPKETYDLSSDPLFELGSHSYTDSSYEGYCFGLTKVPDTLQVEEIGATEKLLRKYAGIDNQLFRFPGGCFNSHAVELVNQANDIVIHWDVNGNDGFNNKAENIYQNVISGTQNGSIIILHLNGQPTAPKTAEALPMIIETLKGRGFEFVKVNELLGISPEFRVPRN